MTDIPRLDILLYAHDGRGLGHVSRTTAIGMALRRLFPALRVLLVTGADITQELIGNAPLDWLKLPSYATIIKNGKSSGAPGKSNFEDAELGRLRSQQIRQIVSTYRPRVVLADHSPQGKHRELLPALQAGVEYDIHWVLGIRGVVGQVKQVGSDLATSTFQDYYSSLLWYGDSNVLGKAQLTDLHNQFGTTPQECGYVSGLRERQEHLPAAGQKEITGTIAIPWLGEDTPVFLQRLYNVLAGSGDNHTWHLYLDRNHSSSARFYQLFSRLPGCRIEPPSQRYLDSLLGSRCAIVYGGYNSLMDVLSLNLPALVLLRNMQDSEQQLHLAKLQQTVDLNLTVAEEKCGEEKLHKAVNDLPHLTGPMKNHLNLSGATKAAQILASFVNENR
ncbi:MAG: hypothetical protein QNJ17_11415 [Desulfocapsaceae bacterium]|nr:hypothetical protein [Desulfocapsaceae bacterium]